MLESFLFQLQCETRIYLALYLYSCILNTDLTVCIIWCSNTARIQTNVLSSVMTSLLQEKKTKKKHFVQEGNIWKQISLKYPVKLLHGRTKPPKSPELNFIYFCFYFYGFINDKIFSVKSRPLDAITKRTSPKYLLITRTTMNSDVGCF